MPEFENPPATIDLPGARVTRIVTIDAPPSLVWRCLVEPDLLVQWLGDIAAFPEGVVEGTTGRFAWSGEVVLAARILELVPESRLRFEWSEGILSTDASSVALTLRPIDGGTQVHLEESGFSLDGDETARRGNLRALAQGWTVELDELVALAERLERADVSTG